MTLPQATLDRILSSIQSLPPLPATTGLVLRLTDDPESTISDVAQAISGDQALAASILKLANSAYYGFSRRIGSIQEGIVLLGFAAVRSLTFASAAKGLLGRQLEGYMLEAGELWRHSLGCATAARIIAKRTRYPRAENAFVAGLLHDIGKVVLNLYVHEQYVDIVELTKQGRSFADAEQQVIGADHCQVGSGVAGLWNLPPDLTAAIADHHQPGHATDYRELVNIVHVADAICLMLGIGVGSDGLLYPLSLATLQEMGIDMRGLDQLIEEVSVIVADIGQESP
jgi:putative nucleotidyltransferase with HDIG domain